MYIFPFTRIRYIKTITINTHIDCSNNSKCSVRDILLATKQGAFESVFGTFSVNLHPDLQDTHQQQYLEIAAYSSLKDERYFDGFKRSLLIVAKTHECNEVLEPNYTPGSEPEAQELFEAKQTFMFSVFNANLQTDMGKTIVRRHLANTDAQSVWKELSEHMRTSSKGASEKRRLTQYVTNTVLDDNLKGTSEQFVLHFNEQFRQLDEISEDSEKLPPTVKLALLQTAVRSINDLRIVETLDEFQSTTYRHGSSTSLSYDTYYDLLINACIRYDKT